MTTLFTAYMGGHSWSRGPSADFNSIHECIKFAESYGNTADWCEIVDCNGRVARRFYQENGDWFETGD